MAVSEFDFPYHRPSVLSLVTAESVQMPESIGFVLLQVYAVTFFFIA